MLKTQSVTLHFPGGPVDTAGWPAAHLGAHPTSRSTPAVVPEAALTVHLALAHASRIVSLRVRADYLLDSLIAEAGEMPAAAVDAYERELGEVHARLLCLEGGRDDAHAVRVAL